MRILFVLPIALSGLLAAPLAAQVMQLDNSSAPMVSKKSSSKRVVRTGRWVERYDRATGRWVRVDGRNATRTAPVERFARYGPFRVVDATHAEMVGATSGSLPAHFAAMMRDFPDIATLSMIEAPGTKDSRANLRLGRIIRAAELATHVPHEGSVPSGAIELLLADTRRTIADRAQFAVHSWIDSLGRQAGDLPMAAP